MALVNGSLMCGHGNFAEERHMMEQRAAAMAADVAAEQRRKKNAAKSARCAANKAARRQRDRQATIDQHKLAESCKGSGNGGGVMGRQGAAQATKGKKK